MQTNTLENLIKDFTKKRNANLRSETTGGILSGSGMIGTGVTAVTMFVTACICPPIFFSMTGFMVMGRIGSMIKEAEKLQIDKEMAGLMAEIFLREIAGQKVNTDQLSAAEMSCLKSIKYNINTLINVDNEVKLVLNNQIKSSVIRQKINLNKKLQECIASEDSIEMKTPRLQQIFLDIKQLQVENKDSIADIKRNFNKQFHR